MVWGKKKVFWGAGLKEMATIGDQKRKRGETGAILRGLGSVKKSRPSPGRGNGPRGGRLLGEEKASTPEGARKTKSQLYFQKTFAGEGPQEKQEQKGEVFAKRRKQPTKDVQGKERKGRPFNQGKVCPKWGGRKSRGGKKFFTYREGETFERRPHGSDPGAKKKKRRQKNWSKYSGFRGKPQNESQKRKHAALGVRLPSKKRKKGKRLKEKKGKGKVSRGRVFSGEK